MEAFFFLFGFFDWYFYTTDCVILTDNSSTTDFRHTDECSWLMTLYQFYIPSN
jgi:hypothetical protein